MVLAINDKMVHVKFLDEDRQGALEVVQKQKEHINETLKRNNYQNYKKHYLLQRIIHNIKQIEIQNSNIKYLKNLEQCLGKDHPEYKKSSQQLNECQNPYITGIYFRIKKYIIRLFHKKKKKKKKKSFIKHALYK
jgi:hypothetical protein